MCELHQCAACLHISVLCDSCGINLPNKRYQKLAEIIIKSKILIPTVSKGTPPHLLSDGTPPYFSLDIKFWWNYRKVANYD